MRLFVAIDLDETSRRAVAQVQRQLTARLARDRSLKWVSPDRMHLTLAFLGEIGDPAAAPIVEELSAPLGVSPFAAVFRGFGVFPPRGAPRVLWLGVDEGADRIVEVQRQVAMRLDRVGVGPEGRPFHPHLTLARWRPPGPSRNQADSVRTLCAGSSGSGPVARIDVDHVTLYQSRLSPVGPTYTALARATLT